MSLLTDLRDKYITKPIAEKLLSSLSIEKADTPSVYQVPFGFNQSNLANNKQWSSGNLDAKVLRTISVTHETTRACINVRKRQITQLDFEVVELGGKPEEAEKTKTARDAVKKQVMALGGEGVKFRSLLNKLIEDLLVLDGFVFYKQRTAGGRLVRLVPIDPATIKIRVDENGNLPQPPDFAYEQWIYGKKTAEMTTKELTYEMMNPRSNSPYGLSPIESAVMAIDASMRATMYNTNYLNDNNIPMGFMQMPEGWTVQQIKEYKEWFDAMLTGSKNTSKVFPIPNGAQYQASTKPSDFSFKDFFDYLDRKICMLFDVTPQEIGLSLQQYKENAEEQGKIQIRRGIKPLANFIEEIFTDIIQLELGYTNYRFTFTGIDGSLSVDEIDKLVKDGLLSGDEAREELGRGKIGFGNVIFTGATVLPVEQIGVTPVMDAEIVDKEEKPKDEEPPKHPKAEKAEDTQDLNKKKADTNAKLDQMEANQKFVAFKNSVKDELERQLKPFTDPEVLAPIMDVKKAYDSDVEYELESVLDDIELNNYEKFAKWGVEEGIKDARTNLGLTATFTLTNRRFIDILGDREQLLIQSVNDTTKKMLSKIISEGKSKGLTNEEVADQITEQIPTITANRADVIARTEIANALGTARLDEYKRRGVEKKRWVVVEDIGDQCGEFAALGTVDIDYEFEPGVLQEPAHPNCRCYVENVKSGSILDL